ncbi:hypothetical protein IYY11_00470 [Methylocystis sp. H62]|uniref:hypothetical protein n=1 Tax=Methylocystis sp. H62 TaxID=2785789 RepID=UPI0018C1EF17|nr:hypothetical protein [Methylocystis sp. H62]MBG0791983.1 hypothetical protein [Methylocystis sp. H62]
MRLECSFRRRANAERLQRAAHGVDEIFVASDYRLAVTQEQSDALAVVSFDMGDLEQA